MPARSSKGERQSHLILDAAMRCLGRDGYASTSVQRVADEAGLSKQVVLYYFGTREQLFDRVSRRIGERLVAQIEGALDDLDDADPFIAAFDRVWAATTADPALQVAWLGVHVESITEPELRATAVAVADALRAALARMIDMVLERGGTLTVPRDGVEVAILAGLQGLLIEFVERGDTPELQAAIGHWRVWVNSLSQGGADQA